MTKAKQLRGLTVKRRSKGEILLARGNAIDGSKQEFALDKGAKGKDSTFGTTRFSDDGKEYLNVTVTIRQLRRCATTQ